MPHMNTITIKNTEYNVRLSWRALKRFCAESGLKLNQLADINAEHYEELLYQGIITANPGCTLKKADIEDWLDEDMGRLAEVTTIITHQFGNEQGDEKKQ